MNELKEVEKITTLEQFLEKLASVEKKFSLVGGRFIRSMDYFVSMCPIEAVARKVFPKLHVYGAFTLGELLGMPESLVTQIVRAADQTGMETETVRAALLKTLGLEEINR